MSRKSARDVAMKMAFATLMGGEEDYATILEQSNMEVAPNEVDMAFARDIVEGVQLHEQTLDAMITQSAIGWALDRMPKVDLCILRIALYEMQHREDIPHSVSINEAVELAKRYSGEKSPAFINGLLGTLSKQINRTGQGEDPPDE